MFDSVILSGGENAADWADTFLVDLRQGFAGLGLEAVALRQREGTHLRLPETARELMARGRRFFLFDLNARHRLKLRPGSGPFPRFSLMVDHPASHAHAAEVDDRHLLGVIDRSHVDGIYFGSGRRVFVPHGGPQIAEAPGDGARPVHVVFSGNIETDTALPPEHYLGGSPEVTVIAAEAIERTLAGEEPSRALAGVLAGRGFAPPALGVEGYATLLGFVTGYSQSVMRERVLCRLGGLSVSVIGLVCDRLRRRFPDSFTRVDPSDFTEVRRVCRRARLCLNISHKFVDGAHERIWYGMAQGCAVVTNETPYLREFFNDGESILFYRGDGLEAARLADVIASGRDADIAAAAAPVWLAHHTWKRRAAVILAAMDAVWADPRPALASIFGG